METRPPTLAPRHPPRTPQRADGAKPRPIPRTSDSSRRPARCSRVLDLRDGRAPGEDGALARSILRALSSPSGELRRSRFSLSAARALGLSRPVDVFRA
jgi:hypothetical protein